ncbi:hypothetical protein K504DRAFT_101506 [Pleomassaria siparia CBS 279.74]|uniref:Uncharacterized protein n=1 Tax=Pleomassaria siparia CBS 279.74 TaxID=1314801 RepID=A0A6G1JZ09_9PLEO|nr:hypothetical protein K504DRAFT_101506 [Pleomassaria siparia CBS 279.74]
MYIHSRRLKSWLPTGDYICRYVDRTQSVCMCVDASTSFPFPSRNSAYTHTHTHATRCRGVQKASLSTVRVLRTKGQALSMSEDEEGTR